MGYQNRWGPRKLREHKQEYCSRRPGRSSGLTPRLATKYRLSTNLAPFPFFVFLLLGFSQTSRLNEGLPTRGRRLVTKYKSA